MLSNTIRWLIGIVVLFSATICVAQNDEEYNVQWNEKAQSKILDKAQMDKLRPLFPEWKVKQATWPSTEEIKSKSIMVDEKTKASCMEWLQKFMKKQNLPKDLDKNLVAMKRWGLIDKESEQKQLSDVFIVKFKKGHYVIHIQESPYNIIITISDERCMEKARTDHKNYVIEIANSVLNDTLKPKDDPEYLKVHEEIKGDCKITTISWLLESVVGTTKDNKKYTDLPKAWEIGASSVRAETDGRFVRFEIRKEAKGKCPIYDPFIDRFKILESQRTQGTQSF